ncbi:MAG TPA: hypothetical protein GX707_05855 [Epulopiscium sp.]|nr:hypothetical protein [Candidatus Epulonipiscium sp.]
MMNSKIKNYVEVLFSDIPRSKKANELKEEILSNMSERFEDYIKTGKTENQAYSLVISSLGDIDEMLAEVMPSDEFLKSANYYRKRNAKNTAISVAMYIIGAVFLIGFGGIGQLLGNEELYGIIGLLILLVISAIATGIIIYSNMSMPLEYKDYNEKITKEFTAIDNKHSRLLKNILSIYWLIMTFIYLAISFLTGQWGITWIIWILAAVFESIIKTIFEMRYGNE